MRSRNTTAAKSFTSGQNSFGSRNPTLPIQTGGQVFEDGNVIELVGDEESWRLLLSDGDRHRIAPCVVRCGRSYTPLALDPSILRAVTLPMKVAPREPTRTVFNDVRRLLVAHDFPDDVALPATYFCFATWFPDCLPAAPCFVVTGPRAGASLLLQLLGCLVRHPLQLVDISGAGFRSLPAQLQLTLLVDHTPTSTRGLRILFGSTSPNLYFPWKNGVVNLYGARAIYLGPTLDDDFSEEVFLHVNLGPSRQSVPLIDASARQVIASNFQPRMLAYRVCNCAKVRTSDWEPPRFASGLRILARLLAASIVDAPDLQAGVGSLLRGQQENVRAERWLDLRCIVIEALLGHCHCKNGAVAYVGDITHTAVTISRGRGQTATLEPRRLGDILRKSLGLFPTRDGKGFKISLTDDVRRRVHELARDFEVESMRDGVARCKCCADIFAVDESCRRGCSKRG